MRRYAAVTLALAVVFLALFGLVEALGVPLLSNPSPWLRDAGVLTAVAGVGLLVADVALPVPASLIMIAHGAVFGVVLGSALSVAGGVGAALVGFGIGRRGGPLLARLVGDAERSRADRLLGRWGTLAIIVTRPVPILAETVAILAGASPLGWRRLAFGALAGTLPVALLYGLTGAVSAGFGSATLAFGLVVAVAGIVWLAGRWAGRTRSA